VFGDSPNTYHTFGAIVVLLPTQASRTVWGWRNGIALQ